MNELIKFIDANFFHVYTYTQLKQLGIDVIKMKFLQLVKKV